MVPSSRNSQPVAEEQRPSQPPSSLRKRERGMDKTLADSYPASDPPSSIPDPMLEDDQAA